MSADRNISEYKGETPLEVLSRTRLGIATHPERFTPEEAIDFGVSLIRAEIEYYATLDGHGLLLKDLGYLLSNASAHDYYLIKQYLAHEAELTFVCKLQGDINFMVPKDPMSDFSPRIKAIAYAMPDYRAAVQHSGLGNRS